MSDIVIRVEHLSKRYRLGEREPYKSLREAIVRVASAPIKRLGGKAGVAKNPEYIWALDDVSFEVRQGEAVGIIGRNGAGKSTLLKVLSRITKPTMGTADIYGRVGSLLEVGTGFHPELTGRENIYLNGAILGMKRQEIDRKFDEIVEFAEIEQFLDTPVKRYSSGMYLRLAFAVAAHLEPEILLVDEVLAVGDAEFQKKCLGKMGEVAKGGRTVLYVSHNMPSIQLFCPRVIWINSGKLQSDNESNQVITDYLSEGINFDSSEVILLNHPRRSHSKEPAIEKVWIIDNKGKKNNTILMGEGITIYFQFHSNHEILYPGFGFEIEDENSRPIFYINNFLVPTELNSLKSISSGIAKAHIPKFPLMPGSYYVNLAITSENDNEWVDYIKRSIVINVEPNDIYGSGKIPQNSAGVIYVSGQITINSDSDI